MHWIETIARRKGISPPNIDIRDIFVTQLPQTHSNTDSNLNPNRNLNPNNNGTLDPNPHHPIFDPPSSSRMTPLIMQPIKSMAAINTMFATHTDQDIQIRTLLILHMNDLILPLLPLLSGLNSGDSPIGGGKNEPSYLLNDLKHLMFLSIVHEFTYKICRTHDSTYCPTYVIKGSVAPANQEEEHAGQIYVFILFLSLRYMFDLIEINSPSMQGN